MSKVKVSAKETTGNKPEKSPIDKGRRTAAPKTGRFAANHTADMGNKPAKAAPKKTGRPSLYTEALAETICDRLSCGESLRKICRDPGMPDHVTVIRWLGKNEAFAIRYARAREIQAHVWVDEMYELASSEPERQMNGALDSASVTHIRNRVATMQWLAMKLNPKKYGDKVDVNHGNQPENPLTVLLKQVSGTGLPVKSDPEED